MSQKTLPANALSQTADYARPYFHVVVDDTVTLKDLLTPAFWAHHARALQKPGGLVDVIRSDLTLDVSLRVLEAGVGYVRMRPLRVYEDKERAKEIAGASSDNADAADIKLPDEYKITTTGRGGFTVTFVPNDAKIATSLKTRAAAVQAAKDHAKSAGIAWPEAKHDKTNTGT